MTISTRSSAARSILDLWLPLPLERQGAKRRGCVNDLVTKRGNEEETSTKGFRLNKDNLFLRISFKWDSGPK